MLYFRTHNYTKGHEFYKKAEELAPKESKPLVIIHWEKEEAHAKTEHAHSMLQLAQKVSSESDNDYIKKHTKNCLARENQFLSFFLKITSILTIHSLIIC